MEEKKKKKKLTLSASFNKPHSVPRYTQGKGKTSVVIAKKPSKRWGEKKFQSRDSNFNKPKSNVQLELNPRFETDQLSPPLFL